MDWAYDRERHASLTNAVVEAIADHRGVDPLDLEFSLYSAIDPEALESTFASFSGDELRTEFRVEDVTVCIRRAADGEVAIGVSDREE